MKNTIFTLAAFALLFAGCTKNDTQAPDMDSAHTFTLDVTMPQTQDEVKTRVAFEKTSDINNHGLTLKWENDDKLMLCFDNGGTIYHNEAPIVPGSISADGKKAQFAVTVPSGIPQNATFNLYAVYQRTNTWLENNGGYFNPGTKVYTLESDEGQCILLERGNDSNEAMGVGRIRPMLYFEKTGVVNTASPAIGGISLAHAGWVMALHFKNSSVGQIDIPKFIDIKSSGIKWAWNPGFYPDTTFDFATKTFSITNDEGCDMFRFTIGRYSWLPLSGKVMAAGESRVFYRWIASITDVPALFGTLFISSEKNTTNSIPARTVENGKVYHVYTEWDGIEFKFVPAY